jgi:23S rRNA (uracil1939-C5)-methyltransferase
MTMARPGQAGELVDLRIDGLAAGGDGVGRDAAARVTFVPLAAPGDHVRARIVAEHRRLARAELVEVLVPGPDRVAPPCPLFGTCGGCAWQHIDPAAQVRAKHEIAAAALRRAQAAGLELCAPLAPVAAYGWRRRARLHWQRRRSGQVVLGFFARRTRRIVDAEACPQLEPALARALVQVRARLRPGLTGKGELALVTGDDGAVHVAVTGPVSRAAAAALAQADGIAGVRVGRRRFGARAIAIEPGLVGDAVSFQQASGAGNHALLEVVDAFTQPRQGARILELYAGTGNLTRVLRSGADSVLAVDLHAATPAAGDAPGESALAPVTWRRGAAAAVTAELAAAACHFDLAVLDPPRTGAAAVIAPLARLGPPRIIYISCDPATLARDLDPLLAADYRPRRGQVLDLMPQTAHVEVVVALARPPG